MSVISALQQDGIDPEAPFAIAFATAGSDEAIVLGSAPDADQATLVFHDERERLAADHVTGHLLLIYHDEVPRMLLRELLG